MLMATTHGFRRRQAITEETEAASLPRLLLEEYQNLVQIHD